MKRDPKAGMVTGDKLYVAAYLRGCGMTHDEIAKKLDIKNTNLMVSMLRAHMDTVMDTYGITQHQHPGMREMRVFLSNARFADVASMTRQAGYQLETGVQEFLEISAKDRTIRDVLVRAKR